MKRWRQHTVTRSQTTRNWCSIQLHLYSGALIGVSGVLISEPLLYSTGSSIVSLNSLSNPPLFLALMFLSAAWYFSSCVPGCEFIHSSSSPSSRCSSWYRFSSCSRLSRPLLDLVSILILSNLAPWVRTPPYNRSHRCHQSVARLLSVWTSTHVHELYQDRSMWDTKLGIDICTALLLR